MKKKLLEKIIEDTKSNPYINWKDETILEKIINDSVYPEYLFNRDGNHGYFSFLNNLVSAIEGIVVEVGNREGLGILSMYNGLKENQKFYSTDIVNDIRFVPTKIVEDPRVHILNDFNSLDEKRVAVEFEPKSISLVFFDTVHTYEQISEEYKIWEPYLKDDCVILIDDIRDVQSDRTKWKFHQELDWNNKYDVTDWAHNPSGFGVYLK
jgi:hypothetical protein